mmetsp:Transcript_21306/g.38942  ORF Transcript_21306/g.38942 Transcript_21306/m.38942 type:complete len:212 (+) Transcript_21306:1672-2307(+)
MSAIVKEQVVPWTCPGDQPVQGSHHVFLRWHSLRLVVPQLPDLGDIEAKVLRQQGNKCVRIVDAAIKLDGQANVVDANSDCLPLACDSNTLWSAPHGRLGRRCHTVICGATMIAGHGGCHCTRLRPRLAFFIWCRLRQVALRIFVFFLFWHRLPIVIFRWRDLWCWKAFNGSLGRLVVILFCRSHRGRQSGTLILIVVCRAILTWRRRRRL